MKRKQEEKDTHREEKDVDDTHREEEQEPRRVRQRQEEKDVDDTHREEEQEPRRVRQRQGWLAVIERRLQEASEAWGRLTEEQKQGVPPHIHTVIRDVEVLSIQFEQLLDENGRLQSQNKELLDEKRQMRTEIGQMRTEILDEKRQMHTQIGQMRIEILDEKRQMHTQIGDEKRQMHAQIGQMRTEILDEKRQMHTQIGQMHTQVGQMLNLQLRTQKEKECLLEENKRLQQQTKMPAEAAMRASAYSISIPFHKCEDTVLWEEEAVSKNVSREIVSFDEILDIPARRLVAELRWLHLHLYEAPEESLNEVMVMRSKRGKGEPDLELPYHPLVVSLFSAASSGLVEVTAEPETLKGHSRPDLLTKVGDKAYGHEVKSLYNVATQGNGIDENANAMGKLLKVAKKFNRVDPTRREFHVWFLERCEHAWLVYLKLDAEGCLEMCRVAPHFPSRGVPPRGNLLVDLAKLHCIKGPASLKNVLPVRPTDGFRRIVQYVDYLCLREKIPLAPLKLMDRKKECVVHDLDNEEVEIVAYGPKSLVFKVKAVPDAVFKVSGEEHVKRELQFHTVLDGIPHIRASDASGLVDGAGDGLWWIQLRGYGECLCHEHVSGQLEKIWLQASTTVNKMHEKGIFHRDIKPSNMIIIGGDLYINDFDLSCFMQDANEKRKTVGTPFYLSPKINRGGFSKRDDFISLLLSLLEMLNLYYEGMDKSDVLKRAQNFDVLPSDMRQKIKECLRE